MTKKCKLCLQEIKDIVPECDGPDPIRKDRYTICPCCYQVQKVFRKLGKTWQKKVDIYIAKKVVK